MMTATAQRPERKWAWGGLLLLLAWAGSATAAVPQLLTYQGKLLDGAGVPVPDGTYTLRFRFYDDCVLGNLLLTETHVSVSTQNGIYSVVLGSGPQLPGTALDLLSVFANNDLVCLGVQVNADTEMVPRQQITSAAYAVRARFADSSPNGIGAPDNITWEGNHVFQQTITLSDARALTWPHLTGNPPPNSSFSVTKLKGLPPGQLLHPNGEEDEQWMICYNCKAGSTLANDLTQHSMNLKIEANYWDGQRELAEFNQNFWHPTGGRLTESYDLGNQPLNWRPYFMTVQTTPWCVGGPNDGVACTSDADCLGGLCIGENAADFAWTTSPIGACEGDHQIECTKDYEAVDCFGVGGNCLVPAAFVVNRGGRGRLGHGLDLLTQRTRNLRANGDRLFRISAAIEPGEASPGVPDVDGVIHGISSTIDLNENAIPGAGVIDLFGFSSALVFSGAVDNRAVSNSLVHFDAQSFLSQTGLGASVGQLIGYRVKHRYPGANLVLGNAYGLVVDSPELGGSVSVNRNFGVLIRDQAGRGTTEDAAIAVSAQSGGDSAKGNIWLKGGGWQDGHLQLASAHLWVAGGTVRYKNGAPISVQDGKPLHSPVGTDSNWGGMYWGDSGSVAHNTGNEVCSLAGLICRDTYDIGSSQSISCASTAHTTPRYLVLCH